MTIFEVKKKAELCEYEPHIKFYRKFPSDYVFDENLSVKENRELVKKHNEEVTMLRAEYILKRGECWSRFKNDMVEAITTETCLSEVQAVLVLDYVLKRFSRDDPNFYEEVEELAEFVQDVVNKK